MAHNEGALFIFIHILVRTHNADKYVCAIMARSFQAFLLGKFLKNYVFNCSILGIALVYFHGVLKYARNLYFVFTAGYIQHVIFLYMYSTFDRKFYYELIHDISLHIQKRIHLT